MLTRKALNELIHAVHHDLLDNGMQPFKIVLFGSYAKGGVHNYSDVDLAVWSQAFTGNPFADEEKVAAISRKHPPVSFRLYPKSATASNFDPFIEIIERTGITYYEQKK